MGKNLETLEDFTNSDSIAHWMVEMINRFDRLETLYTKRTDELEAQIVEMRRVGLKSKTKGAKTLHIPRKISESMSEELTKQLRKSLTFGRTFISRKLEDWEKPKAEVQSTMSRVPGNTLRPLILKVLSTQIEQAKMDGVTEEAISQNLLDVLNTSLKDLQIVVRVEEKDKHPYTKTQWGRQLWITSQEDLGEVYGQTRIPKRFDVFQVPYLLLRGLYKAANVPYGSAIVIPDLVPYVASIKIHGLTSVATARLTTPVSQHPTYCVEKPSVTPPPPTL